VRTPVVLVVHISPYFDKLIYSPRKAPSMLSVPRLEMQVRIFGALADPIRIKILLLLSDGERCVCEILPAFERSQSTISKHLSILYNAGLLDRRIEGNRTIYSIKNRRVVELLETADAIAIAHLSSLVESEGD